MNAIIPQWAFWGELGTMNLTLRPRRHGRSRRRCGRASARGAPGGPPPLVRGGVRPRPSRPHGAPAGGRDGLPPAQPARRPPARARRHGPARPSLPAARPHARGQPPSGARDNARRRARAAERRRIVRRRPRTPARRRRPRAWPSPRAGRRRRRRSASAAFWSVTWTTTSASARAAGRTRLLRSEISSCGAANRGGVREHGTCARRSSRPSTRSSTGWMYRRTWDVGG